MMKFYINPYKGTPIYEQIIKEVKMGIAKKLLKEGEKLPPIREMAIKLSVNPNTVAKAYRELERENIVKTTIGRGTFIKKMKRDSSKKEKIDKLIDMLILEIYNAGYTKEEIINKIYKKEA